MVRLQCLGFAAACLSPVLALPSNAPQDLGFIYKVKRKQETADRAQAVVETFKISWDGYYQFAFPNDELKPVTNGFSNSRNGWGASAVDALSTALIMGEKQIVNQIIDFIPTINWSETDIDVSLFETTIRYLGGMLSGYDFLKGPLANLANNSSDVDALLTQSINLANNLSFAFETPSGMPCNNLNFTSRGFNSNVTGLAVAGTLILEWTRLADLSGNATYSELVNKGQSYLLNPTPASAEPFPGLLGMRINVTTGSFLDAYGGWIGGADSYYEYLIKMFIYDPNTYAPLRDAWIVAADSTIEFLTSHPAPRPDITFVTTHNGTTTIPESQHLACFHGGNFILGGQTLKEQKYIDYGLALVNGCHETYIQTATRIGPEEFEWNTAEVPANQSSFFNTTGFYITNPGYQLRPEVIESYYYAFRATGNPMYQDWAWDAFVAINATTRVGSGYSSISDVNVKDGGNHTDFQESFWFAEVLKYSYLIQAEEAEWQVGKDGVNEWVFNTEAHPVKVWRE
ncbi:hypothetical protein NX059_007078 [Plenodomus lindquistii]|nr:hypothetical protein NX059_007078 [Plenodomus lindquistii]